MAIVYSCAWHHSRIGDASLRFTTASGTYGPVTLSAVRVSHVVSGSVTRPGTTGQTFATGITYALASRLQSVMDPLAPETITVSRSSTTGLYTLASTGATFSLDFTTDGVAGTRMRQLLGMTGNRSGATSYVSQCVPKYTIIPRNTGRVGYPGVGVTSGQGQMSRTGAGAPVGLMPTYFARSTRWEQHYEPETAVFARMADADTVVGGQQYSWEALTEDAYGPQEMCFIEDSAVTGESLAFYLASPPVEQGRMRPVQPARRRFVVPIDALVMGII